MTEPMLLLAALLAFFRPFGQGFRDKTGKLASKGKRVLSKAWGPRLVSCCVRLETKMTVAIFIHTYTRLTYAVIGRIYITLVASILLVG